MNNQTHCNKPIKGRKEGKLFVYYCETCGQTGKGKTQDAAWKAFMTAGNKAGSNTTTALAPRSPMELPAYIAAHASEITALVSPVVSEKPAMKMLISRNMRYVQKAQQLDNVWQSAEGQQSIVTAMEDALILGAELGKMGDIVPYGKTCEFIPAVEAYEFALTNGKSAPFKWLKIEAIHKNDVATVGRKDGNFFLTFENMGRPRGDVDQVAVYGEYRDGQVLGELYDAARLLEKMAVHSSSYKYFLQDSRSVEVLRSEGKIKTKNGREYFKKQMNGKNGSWEKDIYIDELSNPYDGADQPEMLRKAAGKSFLRKYARVRNAEAAMAEMSEENEETIDSALERSLNAAMDQFPDDMMGQEPVTVQAEVVEDEPEPDVVEPEIVEEAPATQNEAVQGELQIDD